MCRLSDILIEIRCIDRGNRHKMVSDVVYKRDRGYRIVDNRYTDRDR